MPLFETYLLSATVCIGRKLESGVGQGLLNEDSGMSSTTLTATPMQAPIPCFSLKAKTSKCSLVYQLCVSRAAWGLVLGKRGKEECPNAERAPYLWDSRRVQTRNCLTLIRYLFSLGHSLWPTSSCHQSVIQGIWYLLLDTSLNICSMVC